MTLIHVLGSDIPHHNHTVLRFFNDVMSVDMPTDAPRRFMVASAAPESLNAYPHLQIEVYPGKRALASAVIAQAADRTQRFFFHGQFNGLIDRRAVRDRIHIYYLIKSKP